MEIQLLSPPRHLVGPSEVYLFVHVQKDGVVDRGQWKLPGLKGQDLYGFLKEQVQSLIMVATCYAWLLENKMRAYKNKGERNKNIDQEFVVPVMNIRRGKMWKQRQAAWPFHHVGLDATSLLFANEVGSACTVLTDNCLVLKGNFLVRVSLKILTIVL
ncbi:hypothetical protein PHJA_002893700 [Phtheirospermum japonicum]|uniref:Uncharacterized protein n=1 Tax=Phtheirospermum japonicum TaxID=374723 RepID=A0A830DL58_9LAMI|nr:hypothetical protein PHJA_002893700 [Phtheirospermum japonicum]